MISIIIYVSRKFFMWYLCFNEYVTIFKKNELYIYTFVNSYKLKCLLFSHFVNNHQVVRDSIADPSLIRNSWVWLYETTFSYEFCLFLNKTAKQKVLKGKLYNAQAINFDMY